METKTHFITHITLGSVLKFTFPTMVMMVFLALYQMLDGVFISNYVGTDALSAVNTVYFFIRKRKKYGYM